MIARPIHAFVLAAVLGAAIAPAGAQALGRLFYTPEQRAAITQARLRGTPVEGAAVETPGATATSAPVDAVAAGSTSTVAAPATATAPPGIVLNGILDRPGGRMAWLDGTAVRHGQSWRGHRVEVGARSVRLLREGAPARVLGIGERLDLVSGQVLEPLAPGAVRRTSP